MKAYSLNLLPLFGRIFLLHLGDNDDRPDGGSEREPDDESGEERPCGFAERLPPSDRPRPDVSIKI